MLRPRLRYHERYGHSVEVWVYKPSKTTIKRWLCSGNEKNKLKQQSGVNIQNTEDDLNILLRILLHKNFITIAQLISLRDYALYAWTQLDTLSICTPEERRTLQQSYCSTGRATLNTHLPSGLAFCHLYRYLVPNTSVDLY